MTRTNSHAVSFTGGSAGAPSAERIAKNRVVERGARAGFVMTGVVHILIGLIAVRLAVGAGGGTADQSGAMAELAARPFGRIMLWAGVIGFVMLAMWRLFEAIFGRSRDSGDDTRAAIAHRAKSIGEAAVYLALTYSAFQFARGGASGGGGRGPGITARLLQNSGGIIVLVVAGLAIIGVGGYYVYKGARAKFMDDLDASAGDLARWLGIAGYIAKGSALAAVGVLVIVATTRSEPDKASGLDGALKTLGAQPYGAVLLIVAAAGIVTYGLYNFVRARHAEL
ncbi:DUF1206 domain-containing protein [Nocardia arizonensis]|uniref:DUF1206 domain-containing protein n=1 Tax=Nocardia arizonensis TaxID=1141647 RepID=UPI0006D16616|nr:DUF1206 domain-containing protein [Nocardia arizonensis]